ncbi:hypothetical protein [Nocardioides sp.]|uniref:hypothetical protein n=1 Tax=Nocardioides sp. TaxID=35761 RepID=UPI002736C6F8|nr:hypothetical protein [Nocardioides sp.]MDP3892961.1 hypothetical protein [Nocardioides sp.]
MDKTFNTAAAAVADIPHGATTADRLTHGLRSSPRVQRRMSAATGGIYLALAGPAVIV